MNDNEIRELRIKAMDLGFEQWWANRHRNHNTEAMKHLNCYKGLARAAWHGRDEQVMTMSDAIQNLLKVRQSK